MITLYHRPRSRSTRLIFLLEELGAPYTIQVVSIRTRDGGGALDPANPHPHGKVPVISDDGVVVFESSAIALYLSDRFPGNRLGPLGRSGPRRLPWLAYYTGVLEPALVSKFMNVQVPRSTAGWVAVRKSCRRSLRGRAPYMLGERFSAVDVLYATTFKLFAQSPLLPKTPVIDDYVTRVVARPAFARAMAKEGG